MGLTSDIDKALNIAMDRAYDTAIRIPYPAFPLQKGDRVRIKEGYMDAGAVGFYAGKSTTVPDEVLVDFGGMTRIEPEPCGDTCILAEAIEAYPYSREERIERAIEEFYTVMYGPAYCDCGEEYRQREHAILFAFLDAGV